MIDFPDDELEFRLCWTSKASEVSTYAGCRNMAENAASTAYIRKRDDVAESMRNLATSFQALEQTATSELREYIKEDQRREYEFRSKMKAARPKLTAERG
jgi:hypothetical protein